MRISTLWKQHISRIIPMVATLGLLAQAPRIQAQTINTIAGTGTAGSTGDGGLATAARLNRPSGLSRDIAGNLYIADYSNHRIVKINAVTGIITTVAGTPGSSGFSGDGSAATSAQLNLPTGVTVHQTTGDIYIADRTNNRIRKVTVATGTITTIGGTGSATHGGDGGAATSAGISGPTDVKLNNVGNKLYIGCLNHTIRVIDLGTGVITTIAGSPGVSGSAGDGGLATAATLFTPYLQLDYADNIYVFNINGHKIRKITASTGIITTVAGTGAASSTGDGGLASAATIYGPVAASFDVLGNMYVSEYLANKIRRIDAGTGIITTVAGTGAAGFSGDGGAPTSAQLYLPWGSVIREGMLIFDDESNHRVRSFAICPRVIFVDSSMASSGSGDSWASAKKTLTEALYIANNDALCDVQIWVRKGTYYPTSDNRRDSSFRVLRNNIKIYGGFNGTETSLSARSAATNLTCLSGDIGVSGDSTDNSYHIMTIVATPGTTIDSNVVVDGFTIRDASATFSGGTITVNGQSFFHHDGGGIYNIGNGASTECSPLINNCIFTHNTSYFGSCMYNGGQTNGKSNTIVRNSTFDGNYALSNSGVCINQGRFDGQSNPEYTNCIFTSNGSVAGGGAFFNNGSSNGSSSPVFNNCTFSMNYSGGLGGAIYSVGTAGYTNAPVFNSCTFSNNTTDYGASTTTRGGAISTNALSGMVINNCRFFNNTARASGGAINNDNGSVSTISYSIFSGNSAVSGTGGALSNQSNSATSTTVNNSIFTGNTAGGTGDQAGGAASLLVGTMSFNSCTFSNNTTASTLKPDGNSISSLPSTTLNITNSVVWGTAANQLSVAGTATYTYSLLKGLTVTFPNINTDPLFVNAADPDGTDNTWGTSDDGLYMLPCSGAIGGGLNSAVASLPTDMAGAARILFTTTDMGAYEHNFAGTGRPDIAITASPSDKICIGTNVSFPATVSGTGSTPGYQWYKNGTLVSTSATYSSSTLANNDTIWVILTNTTCNVSDTSAKIVMTVTPNQMYVDSSVAVSGTGMTWATAFKTLTEALTLANATSSSCAVQIWVKKGTYFPPAVRDSSFRIARNNIKVYGGFAGTESTLSARSVTANPTILSADIGIAGDSTDNNYHVMTILASAVNQIDTNTVVDGFTITKGNGFGASGATTYAGITFNRQDGGGIQIYGVGTGNRCSPIINNCIISRNGANFGGGIYGAGFSGGASAAIIKNTSFVSNRASSNGGGAFISGQTSGNNTSVIDSCNFSNNTAANGAGIFYQASGGLVNSILRNTTLQDNTAGTNGGGLYTSGVCTINGTNLLVTGNTATNGGGLYNPSSATVSWTNCRFTGNTATATGGGIYSSAGTLNCTQCIINTNTANNTTSGTGGGLQHTGGGGTYLNSLFVGNTAAGTGGDGGGAAMLSGGTLTLRSSTFSNNTTASTTKPDANSIGTLGGSTLNVLNTIIWGNPATHVSIAGTVNYTNALVKGASLTPPSLSVDPRFVNEALPAGADGIWLTADDGLELLPCSPAVNAATAAAPATDIRNRSRVSTPDMGAYEEQGTPLPTAPVVVSPVTYCQAAIASPLTATKSSATDTLKWYDAIPSLLPGAPTPSTATPGTTTYYVSQTDIRGCESNKATITVVVNPKPVAPTATTPVNYCLGATATALTATASSASDTLKWYNSSMTLLSGAPTPSTATAGTFTWYVSQKTSLGCEGNKTTITVNVNALPAAPGVSSPVTYCQGATATALTATASSGSDTLKWYNSAMTLLAGAPTPSTASVGTTTYYVSQKSSLGCEGPKATINVVVNATPLAPSAPSPITYCQGASSVPLTATLSAGSDTLKWYNSSMTLLSGAPTPSTATAGTFTWYVSQKTSLGCEGPKRTITVTINPTPVAPAAPSPVTYCQGATAAALTATLSAGSDTLKWYNSSMTLLSSAPTPSTATAGTTAYYVSQKTNLGCEGPKTTINVVVNPTPGMPTAPSPVVYCQGATATALTATLSAGSDTLKWYNASMTLLSSAPTPSTATAGTFTWYVSQKTSSGCEGPKRTITVTVNPTPALPTATTPITYCQNAPSTALTATAASSSDTLKWYDAASTLLAGAPTPSTATAGTFTWYVSQKNAFGCEGAKRTITVNVNPTPLAPPATTPVVYCQDDVAVPLSATKASPSDTLKWYNSSMTLLSGAPTPSTTTAGTYTWYVSDKTALGCEGPKTTIVVTVNPKPLAPTVVSPLDICVGVSPAPLTATGTNLKWYLTATGGAGAPSITPPVTATGTLTYYVSQTNSFGCEGPRATLVVNVRPSPTVTVAPVGMPAFVFCIKDSIKLKATSATATSYQWWKETTSVPGATADTFTVSSTATYGVIVKDVYGCADTETVYVMENPLPEPRLSPTDVVFCEGVTVMLYGSPATAGYKYEWFMDNVLMPGIDTNDSYIPVNTAGIYHIRVKDIYNCTRLTNTSSVSTYPAMTKPTIVRLANTLKLTATYASYQWHRNGKVIAGATASSYTVLYDGYYHVTVKDVNGCDGISDTVNITQLKVDQYALPVAKLFPNPTRDKVTIEASAPVQVIVRDMTGREILRRSKVNEVDMSPYADGIYMFYITDEDGRSVLVEKVNKISGQ